MKYWFPNSVEEKNIWEKYVDAILRMPTSSDRALINLFYRE
jgi:hypothetical protein